MVFKIPASLMSPFFSVILPTYNRAHFLPKAIESVLGQTFADWELIIVDDGSTDNTKEVVAAYADSRVVYHYQQNQERSAARNNGIKQARGVYICFLDSDDYFLPERLEGLAHYMRENNNPVGLFFTDIQFKKPDGEFHKSNYLKLGENQKKCDYLVLNIIGVPQACINKTILKENLFDTRFNIGEDFELWLRIVNNYQLTYIEKNTTVVANDHEDRTVNLKKQNSPREQQKMLKTAFRIGHPGHKVNRKLKKWIVAEVYFNEAKHYMFNNNFKKSIKFVMYSLWINPLSINTKHRVLCLLMLLTGKIPEEYQSNQ